MSPRTWRRIATNATPRAMPWSWANRQFSTAIRRTRTRSRSSCPHFPRHPPRRLGLLFAGDARVLPGAAIFDAQAQARGPAVKGHESLRDVGYSQDVDG